MHGGDVGILYLLHQAIYAGSVILYYQAALPEKHT